MKCLHLQTASLVMKGSSEARDSTRHPVNRARAGGCRVEPGARSPGEPPAAGACRSLPMAAVGGETRVGDRPR